MDDVLGIGLWMRPLVFAALAALAFLPLEHVVPARPRPRRRTGLAADVVFATVGQVAVRLGIVVGVGWVLALLDEVAPERPLWVGISSRPARALAEIASGLLLFELGGYAYHRLAHRIGWMWRLHEVHHTSRTMDWLAAFRQHPFELLMLTIAQNAPLVLLGVPLGAHATVVALLKLNTVFVHANIRVPAGPWTQLLATPRFHHRHHQRSGPVRNYASLFPFIDRLFGTYSDETANAFGVARAMPDSYLGLLLSPFRRPTRRAGPPPVPGGC
jgi:sterol desaturase/sphingolipid hydroxylase (fatty acid hydroxylase superfamily)